MANAKEIYTKYLVYKQEELLVGKSTFAENKFAWVMIAKDKYASGEIVGENGNKLTLRIPNGDEFQIEKDKVEYMNPPKFDGANDCAELSYLSEAAVLDNLRKRYDRDIIYV
jgi:myosin heavy subunit